MIQGLLLLAIIVATITTLVKTRSHSKRIQELEERFIKPEDGNSVKQEEEA